MATWLGIEGAIAAPAGLLAAAGLVLFLILLAVAEGFRPLHQSPRDSPGRTGANLLFGALNLGLLALVPISGVLAAALAADRDIGLLNWIDAPPALAFAATLVLRSLAAYGFHRLAHAWPPLWRFHRVHHSDVAVDLSTAFRTHPGEVALLLAVVAVGALALGASPAALALYETIAFGLVAASHANFSLPSAIEARLGRWLATPSVHHIHHSSERHETDSNFGEMIMVWDRLFGTYRAPDRARLAAARIGLGDDFDRDSGRWMSQLRVPFYRR